MRRNLSDVKRLVCSQASDAAYEQMYWKSRPVSLSLPHVILTLARTASGALKPGHRKKGGCRRQRQRSALCHNDGASPGMSGKAGHRSRQDNQQTLGSDTLLMNIERLSEFRGFLREGLFVRGPEIQHKVHKSRTMYANNYKTGLQLASFAGTSKHYWQPKGSSPTPFFFRS